MSRTKLAKDSELEFNDKLVLPGKNVSTNLVAKKEPRNPFDKIGKAYMNEYSKFNYKVDTIINNAYLYVKDLQE